MRNFLINVPNLPRHAVAPDTSAKGMTDVLTHGERILRLKFYPLVHLSCGTKIVCLLSRRDYLSYKIHSGTSRSRHSLARGTVYCPECRVRVGKATKILLKARSRLVTYQTFRDPEGAQHDDLITARITFPHGLEMDPEGEIVGYNGELVDLIDDAEEMPYPPPSRPRTHQFAPLV